jgi:hypothetical protein
MTALATHAVAAGAETPAGVAPAATASPAPATSVVEPSASRLEIDVPVESDVDGLEIECDGVLVPASSYGVAIPVDARTHVLAARAPGRVPWSAQLRLAPGRTTVTIPRLRAELALAPAPADAATALAVAAPTDTATSIPLATTAEKIERNTGKTERTLGLVLAGVGVVGVATGAWLSFGAASQRDELQRQCPWSYCMTTTSSDQLRTQAAAGNALMVLGLASSVGAIVLFLAAPSAPAPAPERRAASFKLAPAVAPGGASLVASGKF